MITSSRLLIVFVAVLSFCCAAHANPDAFTAEQKRSLIVMRDSYASLSPERMTRLLPAKASPNQDWWKEFFHTLAEENLFLSRFEAKRRADGQVQIEIGFSYLDDEGRQHEKSTRTIFGNLTASGVELHSF